MKRAYQWFELEESRNAPSPSLLVYPERIQHNAELMVTIAKGPQRLRPHIKTHKMAEVIQIQMDLGIDKFKCATLSEAELLAKTGASDVLLAMQPVFLELKKLLDLILTYPKTSFSTLIDNHDSLEEMKKVVSDRNMILGLWLDVNNGMNRTGVKPGKEAEKLYKSLSSMKEFDVKGLHVYDGHIHNADPMERREVCDEAFSSVEQLEKKLIEAGCKVPVIIAGGTPTFPVHARRDQVELSPGTPLLWDAGYARNYTDLNFQNAAVLHTKIISKPDENLLCFDLGHKSVASEMKLPRVRFLGDHNFEQISQSEEHLVVKCLESHRYKVGDSCYALPIHICPTVSKYPHVLTVRDHKISGSWCVAARDHSSMSYKI